MHALPGSCDSTRRFMHAALLGVGFEFDYDALCKFERKENRLRAPPIGPEVVEAASMYRTIKGAVA